MPQLPSVDVSGASAGAESNRPAAAGVSWEDAGTSPPRTRRASAAVPPL